MNLAARGLPCLALLTMVIGACAPVSLALPTAFAGGEPQAPAASMALSDRPRDLSPAASPEDLHSLAEGNAAFALDLYHLLAADEGNLFYSPYSISVTLGMTSAGAGGQTADQMATALHFGLPQDRLHAAFNAYSLDLQARTEAVTDGTPFELTIANGLWGQQGSAFLPTFLDLLAEDYGAGMRLADFVSDPEAARQAINQWVSDETRERIQDVIPSGAIDAITRLVLVNAIYFQAAWFHPFAADATASAPFNDLEGSSIDVPMMHQDQSYGYALREGYRALELPYQSGGVSMLVILPDEGLFQTVEQALTATMLEDIVGNLTYGPVILSLPRFTTESSFSLNSALQALGMTDGFDPDRADFSGMDGNHDLYIGSVLHHAFVSVDENGTEAAAATGVIMVPASAPILEPIEFTVDRPFIYLIRDDLSGTLLFVGRVVGLEG